MKVIVQSPLSDQAIEAIRADFPVLHQDLNGRPLVYFDNAATTQKPKVVIDALVDYYSNYNANIHRGLHTLAEKATAAFEATRSAVATMINAPSASQIVFTKGTTDGINLLANGLAGILFPGDEILITTLEHHSNIVPWQMLAIRTGAVLKVIPIFDNGELDIVAAEALICAKTKIMSCVYVSNALGTINPVEKLIALARRYNTVCILDAAQAISHIDIDVQALDVDALVFSGHKLYAPTGIGVLYGKEKLLNDMPPYQGGGEMIAEVTFEATTFNVIPYKFEAGTPNIADVIALKAAIDYIHNKGKANLVAYENYLLNYATEAFASIEGLKIVGTAKNKVAIISFIIDGVHPQDLGVLLDNYGVAIRTGHHCTQPLMQRLGLPGTCRASFSFYNTISEIDQMVAGLRKAIKMLK